ncbi:hypothetical protein LTR05_001672 [Lithohypha guttulata]|uniref:AHC1-like C2H2 zinc-finger domain-containing protein n=1 Tax=Lithohypha guttulata TaxID=1690604 RepID=A0AAN7YKD7_9EURO|nr:hypothetical protein LTR05_001672 [Lithohypha guttulata]
MADPHEVFILTLLKWLGLPAGFCEPKQKPTGPMILKRKSDGKMVKLVCPDCGRLDFGSAQGFINHCRIGHQRNYASHDAAAEGCGEPIEVDDAGLVKDAPVVSAPPSVVTTPIAVTPSPIIVSATTSSTHPLVKTAHLTSKDTLARPIVQGGFIPKSERKSAKPRIRSPQVQNSDTPHLSALVQSRETGINLEEAVAEAKRRDDLHEEWEFDAFVDFDSPLPTPKNSRHPHVAGKKPSGKSVNAGSNARKPAAPNQVCASMSGSLSAVQTPAEEQSFHHFMPLVPSPTNESTQAPSLIDDDEEMDPQSPPSSDEHDETDVHFDIRDDDHTEEHHELRGSEMTANATPCSQTATTAPPFARPLSSKGSRSSNFVAENPVPEGEGDKKRRRIEQ